MGSPFKTFFDGIGTHGYLATDCGPEARQKNSTVLDCSEGSESPQKA
ncbi:conserved hypothetical protein [Acidithiobacillus caldus SM-1]|uniref:Uncharacterized protein n=2 Tax=Acidithiobacillus caldus TaxID=33059 RepID=F9ZLY2_ACICS|nr:conserved hypothetical protein [Acidithiobacillus caldus SM-1]AIA54675.1 hypothetical protein Acaty_c0798 [Acidithiobacillus caldus ATCC 51756]QER43485.1 hypothetical protein F0726_00397 [Acidithiobacillus caldus]